jgi:hypothetical protein
MILLRGSSADILFLNLKGTRSLNSKKLISVALDKKYGLSISMRHSLHIIDKGDAHPRQA